MGFRIGGFWIPCGNELWLKEFVLFLESDWLRRFDEVKILNLSSLPL
jgi:hypothetical protein